MNPITSLFNRFEARPARRNPGSTFDQAFRALPACLQGFDPLRHKTVADLVAMAQFEVDLYNEGDDGCDIHTWKQLAKVSAYIKKFGGVLENPPGRDGEDDLSEFLRRLDATMELKDWPEGTWIRFGQAQDMSDREIADFIEQAAGWVEDTTDGGRKAPERAAWASLR
jgi:hypothetical protein